MRIAPKPYLKLLLFSVSLLSSCSKSEKSCGTDCQVLGINTYLTATSCLLSDQIEEKTPQITAVITPDTIMEWSPFPITVSLMDGDGDLGMLNDSADVFIEDLRSGWVDRYKMPPLGVHDSSCKSLEAKLEITMVETLCIPIPGEPNRQLLDTLHLGIHVVDRAGNSSNTYTTDFFIIKCEL